MSRTPMVLAALALAAVAIPEPVEAADPTSRVVYSGRVEDAQGRPIGGIYPLTFAFYRSAKGGRPLWEESHFVAIDNGVYAVELGREKPFPKRLAFDKSFLGVAISGGKEIMRERFSGEVSQVTPTPEAPKPPVIVKPEPSAGAPPQPAKGTYADQAGFAYEAEKAKNADAVGGMSVAELRTLIKQADTGSKQPVKVTIGENKRFTDQVGGLGGQTYTLQCPPGYVVTGMRGRAAGYVDQISLICSPLE
jgi:hypothetical protein